MISAVRPVSEPLGGLRMWVMGVTPPFCEPLTGRRTRLCQWKLTLLMLDRTGTTYPMAYLLMTPSWM